MWGCGGSSGCVSIIISYMLLFFLMMLWVCSTGCDCEWMFHDTEGVALVLVLLNAGFGVFCGVVFLTFLWIVFLSDIWGVWCAVCCWVIVFLIAMMWLGFCGYSVRVFECGWCALASRG